MEEDIGFEDEDVDNEETFELVLCHLCNQPSTYLNKKEEKYFCKDCFDKME